MSGPSLKSPAAVCSGNDAGSLPRLKFEASGKISVNQGIWS